MKTSAGQEGPADRKAHAVHKIRLGSQWDLELRPAGECSSSRTPRQTQSDPPRTERLRNLADWRQTTGADYNGRVRLIRRFGCPSGLMSGDTVKLIVDSLQPTAVVLLNGHNLRPIPATSGAEPTEVPTMLRYDLSAMLLDRNQLSIDLDVPECKENSEIVRDAWLEIIA